jgi:cbb3-type cytochrome oxidase maturation protein
MSIIYVLITVSVIVALIFFIAFLYSVRKGQYDDTYTPSVRMLFDDELVKPGNAQEKISENKNKTNQ